MTPEEEAVLAPVRTLLDAMAKRDKVAMRAVLMADGMATLIRDGKILRLSLQDLPDRQPHGTAQVEERMHEPLIRIDHQLAMVWGRYDLLVDGAVHHHGTNLIHLIHHEGRWLIAGVADNSRPPDVP